MSASSLKPQQASQIIAKTADWLESVVIDLNLCPFAKQPYQAGRVKFEVVMPTDLEGLVVQLFEQFQWLENTPAARCETLIVIVPSLLQDFDTYNQFLDVVDMMIMEYGWEGIFQVASFHPDYRFAGVAAEDVTNFTNRAPYPLFHLLRESSVQQAVTSQAHIDAIIERNQRTLRDLPPDQLQALFARFAPESNA